MVIKDPKRCSTIRDRVDKWEKYWTINRSLYYEWVDFIMGDQWREDESKLFERYNKIPLMFNKLGVLMNHLLGDQIQNTPNLQIVPDEDVPVETAQARAALIRNISLNSDAKTVYQTAYGQSIVGGYGAFILGTRYLHEESMDQEIFIKDVKDPNRCYWDLSAEHVCKVDGMFAGYKTRMSRRKFKDKWGKDIESQIGTSSITEDSTMAFADDDSITLVDDFEREPEKGMIYKLSDNSVVNDKDFKAMQKVKVDGKKMIMRDGMYLTVLQKRESLKYTIKHQQIAGDFVLEETIFPSKTLLPIIFLDQRSYFTKQGQQITRSFFKDVKDPQKYLNYLATQMAYLTKISRYDQFMGPRKCFASPDIQQIWRDPSIVQGALPYDETPSGAKPEQIRPPELSSSLINQYDRTLMDIQSGTGVYNTQLGEIGNEVSGRAIDKRNQRGSKNTQIPRTALDISIATAGEIINEMIPNVYDTERNLILSTPESDEQRVPINKQTDEYGMQVQNDMTKGRYKIRLKAGNSYEGQKEEALESLQSVLQADRSGQVFPLIADLYAENLPLDNNIEIRNRLRTIVPPEIIEAGKTGKPMPQKPKEPSPDAMMMQLKQQELQMKAQQAQQEMQMKMQEFEFKKQELQRKAIETNQDMQLAFEKLEADKEKAAAQLQESILRYKGELNRIGADLEVNHSQNLIKMLTHAGQIHHEKEMHHKELNHRSTQNK
jgi:Phage P22-like portal protein